MQNTNVILRGKFYHCIVEIQARRKCKSLQSDDTQASMFIIAYEGIDMKDLSLIGFLEAILEKVITDCVITTMSIDFIFTTYCLFSMFYRFM